MTQSKKPFIISPGEQLPESVKTALTKANAQYKKSRDFQKYVNTLENILGLLPSPPLTEDDKRFYAGFLEGEGSMSVGAKKNTSSRFGVYFDPEFSATQHVNGAYHLVRLLCYFRTGLIRYKSKSNATLVYTVDARESLKSKIVPFFEKYLHPYSCYAKYDRFQRWKQLIELFDQGAHLDAKRFLYEIGPLWDELRVQKGQKNESFGSLEEFIQYVIAYLKEKKGD